VGVLAKANVPTLALLDDETRYFWYHHTDADTMDKLNPRELSACAAAMCVMAWQVADSLEPLPRAENGKEKSE
jgi:carboxypeptidase Q